jgi:hypothetical protein
MLNFLNYQPSFLSLKNLEKRTIEHKFFLNKFKIGERIPYKSKKTNYKIIKMNQIEVGEPEIWEIDFFSRPVLNTDGKKLWELIVVNKKNTFEHVEAVPNNLINSKELRKRINQLINSASIKPTIIKFFRSQMFNMISIALSDLDLTIRPSRRTYSLFNKINEREEKIYPNMTGFKPFMRDYNSSDDILRKTPERMPDALRGEKYIFASLDYCDLDSILKTNPLFRDFCPFPENFSENINIPGLIIYSNRSKPLSSWMDGIEVFAFQCDIEQKNLIIECGLETQYLFGKMSIDQIQEAKIFENIKKKYEGLHFVAIQSVSTGKEINGFWLLKA